MASMVAHRFGVVTSVGRAIAAIENNLAKYGLASRCSGVRAIEVPVLALETEGPSRVEQEIQKAIATDGAEAIVLGCAGMASFVPALSARFGIPVLDGIACAVKLAEAMVGAGMKTSKLRAYSTPRTKQHAGVFSNWSAHR
jgi:allantoin racemase